MEYRPIPNTHKAFFMKAALTCRMAAPAAVFCVLTLLAGCADDSRWLSPVKLTDNIYSDETAAISSDGRTIVYASDEGGDYEIVLLEFAGGAWQEPRRLTDNDTPDTMPAISANGSAIAYIGGPADDRKIFFMEHAFGRWQQPMQLTFGSDDHYFPSLSDDGTRITYQAKDSAEKRFIWFMERTAGAWQEPRMLPAKTDNNMFPVISARGAAIAYYAVNKEGFRDMYSLRYQYGVWQGPFNLTDNQVQNCQPSINADGTKIVYYSTGKIFLPHVLPGALADIFLLENKDGVWQTPLPIAAGPYYEYDPTIDAAGTRITFAEAVPGTGDHVYAVDRVQAGWQEPVNLTRGVTSGFRPFISGNGSTIVYYGTGLVEGVTDADNEIYMLTRSAYAGRISGRVVSAADAAPLAGVLVTAAPGQYLAATDSQGGFELRVPCGTYTVTARKNCFATAAVPAVSVRTAAAAAIDISLEGGGNCAPLVPAAPVPENGSRGNLLPVTLSWEGGDPDAEDRVSYDVYTGVMTLHHIEFHSVSGNQAERNCTVSGLSPRTTYFWKIVSRDAAGYETSGPQWSFTTGDN